MKRPIKFLINIYRKYISPLHRSVCRYNPTCSKYAYDAVEEWGAFIGCTLAFLRILRCNPFSKGGNDPVPEKLNKKEKGKNSV